MEYICLYFLQNVGLLLIPSAKSSEETVVEDRLQELMLDLDHSNEKIVLCALCSLGNLTAFKEFQVSCVLLF